ncbi:hypothetical protein P3T76_005045 [Phytophthora citrophthora]|uniref:Uncharacterized protein n=1 Tax=Phytophthora citrophthora TaxID=4793 RepID=A0AAD9GRE1_9STRA|nr:hypothetical protein P3T76_005045 [Phytophthora citrophthora]
MTTAPDRDEEGSLTGSELTGFGVDGGVTDMPASQHIARMPRPIFAIVNAPMITSMARRDLVEWLKLRKEYVEYTKERCKDGKEDISTVLKIVKRSFDASVLETSVGEWLRRASRMSSC